MIIYLIIGTLVFLAVKRWNQNLWTKEEHNNIAELKNLCKPVYYMVCAGQILIWPLFTIGSIISHLTRS